MRTMKPMPPKLLLLLLDYTLLLVAAHLCTVASSADVTIGSTTMGINDTLKLTIHALKSKKGAKGEKDEVTFVNYYPATDSLSGFEEPQSYQELPDGKLIELKVHASSQGETSRYHVLTVMHEDHIVRSLFLHFYHNPELSKKWQRGWGLLRKKGINVPSYELDTTYYYVSCKKTDVHLPEEKRKIPIHDDLADPPALARLVAPFSQRTFRRVVVNEVPAEPTWFNGNVASLVRGVGQHIPYLGVEMPHPNELRVIHECSGVDCEQRSFLVVLNTGENGKPFSVTKEPTISPYIQRRKVACEVKLGEYELDTVLFALWKKDAHTQHSLWVMLRMTHSSSEGWMLEWGLPSRTPMGPGHSDLLWNDCESLGSRPEADTWHSSTDVQD